MNILLFDDDARQKLLPLTFTKPVAEIRIGMLSIRDKWKHHIPGEYSYLTREYLQEKFPPVMREENLLINASVLPDKNLTERIGRLDLNEKLVKDEITVAARLRNEQVNKAYQNNFEQLVPVAYEKGIHQLENVWQIFVLAGEEISRDLSLITAHRKSCSLSKTNQLIAPENIFVEEGVKAEYVTINASKGPVYLGKDSEIMEGSAIRGPFALCEHAVLKLSAKIYGPTVIGPFSKVGGEVNNSVIQGYSNKAHDGFLGNSVIGEWCNLGADTNNSNLKNNYADVKLWSYQSERFINSGLQFCGLIMGDHSKCGINTMFNTGTVVGVSANIYGSGFPRNFIPSFSWGGAQGFQDYKLNKAFEVARKAMQRRNIAFTSMDESIFSHIYEFTKKYRK